MREDLHNCSMCSTKMVERTYTETYLKTPRDWNGERIEVSGLLGWYCNKCDDYVIDYSQAMHNDQLVAASRKVK